jgi:hypothetical protein
LPRILFNADAVERRVHLTENALLLEEGSVDRGLACAMALIAAETLGMPYASVKPAVVDTSGIGYSDLTGQPHHLCDGLCRYRGLPRPDREQRRAWRMGRRGGRVPGATAPATRNPATT